ncbi:MAG: tetratricopeptide repeat protein [Chloroflexi bacterium]|nr:MAG: tetratricopeptide repeat protein [Chloroflexota bacterium]
MPLPIGTVLDGKFKIVQVLGEGGMGTVYKVELVGRPGYYRAVKELLINLNTSAEERRSAIERFDKEIDLLFSLKHPHIPSFLLSFQERGNYYFVMEFVPGQSLDKMLEKNKGPLNEEDVIKWMMQVCEALSYIHSFNPPIILRDLKPGNVMVTPSGDVQLIDFGIARRFDPNKRTNTENLGTISYASPEHLGSLTSPGQRRSPQNPGKLVQTDARSDIYSLGATMYHLLTNYEPDPIQTPATGSIRAKNPRLRIVRVGNTVVCPVEQVIIKAMQQNPDQRFQNAEAMRTALQHCLPNYAPPSTVQIPAVTSANATILVPTNGLICPRCGFQNRPGAKFCKRDGQPLTQGATAVPPQARVQYAARAPIQARPIASQPIRARPVAVSAPPAGDPVTVSRSGLQHLNNKNYVEAINQFRLALSFGKPSYDVLYNLGRAYRQYGQSVKEKNKKLFNENLKLAAEQFEQAIRLKADALDAFFQLGMSYRDLALYAQASATFKKAQQLAPQDPAIYYQLGMVAMEQGYNRDAEKYFQQGLKINPEHALILASLGHLYIKTGRARSAISTLLQATQREPALPDGWYELGRAYMETREWQPALNAFGRALQLNNDAVNTYSAMASCYLKMNKRSEARQKVDQALQLDQSNAEALRVKKQL